MWLSINFFTIQGWTIEAFKQHLKKDKKQLRIIIVNLLEEEAHANHGQRGTFSSKFAI